MKSNWKAQRIAKRSLFVRKLCNKHIIISANLSVLFLHSWFMDKYPYFVVVVSFCFSFFQLIFQVFFNKIPLPREGRFPVSTETKVSEVSNDSEGTEEAHIVCINHQISLHNYAYFKNTYVQV